MDTFDIINRDNAEYIEEIYQQYLKDPRSLDDQWVAFFSGFELGSGGPAPRVISSDGKLGGTDGGYNKGVYALVSAYRELGHFTARLDPLGHNRTHHPLLELSEFALAMDDMDRKVGTGGFLGPADGTLRDLIEKLRQTYCRTLGVEYMEIPDKTQRNWLQAQMEPILNRPSFSPKQCHRLLFQLVEGEVYEQFLQSKYLGQKRFSLEGAEAMLPLIDTLVEEGSALGVKEMVMGMAHRGRVNVLAHILHKPYEMVLSEFEGTPLVENDWGDGDVKYHKGYSYDHPTRTGHTVHLSLVPNPSHLELVNPVVQGIVSAKQEHLEDREGGRVVPVLIHGEAAFTGQGIVPEILSLSELEGYRTGGTIHIIVNNQVGFTATPSQTRFTPYPTDVAKMIHAPVFHVNADDPQAVVHAARLAIAFRQQFKGDVFIDLWCYRRHGHNEGDDPTFTQPLMYREIEGHASVCELYAGQLIEEGTLSEEDVRGMRQHVRDRLESAQEVAQEVRVRQRVSTLEGLWKGLERAGSDWSAQTAVKKEVLQKIGEGSARTPSGFTVHRKLKRFLSTRLQMVRGKRPLDWGCAEMLAFGSLLLENVPVRLVGQDSERGTFSHRHAVLHDFETGDRYVPLAHLDRKQARFTVLNTMLSELAVLGFEYAISSADPHRLVIWEAQFGDFANGAQPVIDQFISSAESKWHRMNGLVLLLPHGYEGQGPEHSSARLERFLQLCAEENMQVCYPSTPAQYFHALRQQMHRNFRKPLVLMTPKSLLRHKLCVSPLEDLSQGQFRRVIDDAGDIRRDNVRRVVFCAGKVYYDLLEARQERGAGGVALVRVEQLYPFPREEMASALGRYKQAEEVFWVQEEPQNMGAWSFVAPRLRGLAPDARYVGREEAASPAPGLFSVHKREHEEILNRALSFEAS